METAVIIGIGIVAVVLVGFQLWGKMKPKDGSSSGCDCGCGACACSDKHRPDDRDRS